MMDTRVVAFGMTFKSPVLCASGTFGYGREFADLCDLSQLGGIVTKGISLDPRAGNPPPRLCETAAGMLNSIGLENVGVRQFVEEKLPFLRDAGTRVLVNFFGAAEEEYVRCAEQLSGAEGIDALEANISCPNIKAGGIEFGTDAQMAGAVIQRICQATDHPVIAKLTPNVTDIVPIARACVEAGASGISLVNTLKGMAVDARGARPRLGRVYGGLSGPAIKPVALRLVYQVAQARLGVPIIGMGGIFGGEDAVEFLQVGSALVQVGTANFTRPDAALQVTREMVEFCQQHHPGMQALAEQTGTFRETLP